jgi:hypothetical protein
MEAHITTSRCLALLTIAVATAQVPDRPSRVEPALVNRSKGPSNAPITILVFADFESSLCARSAKILRGLLSESQDVRLVFKHAPAVGNAQAMLAHEAAMAAGAQGKFWQMHDLLFANKAMRNRGDVIGWAKNSQSRPGRSDCCGATLQATLHRLTVFLQLPDARLRNQPFTTASLAPDLKRTHHLNNQ